MIFQRLQKQEEERRREQEKLETLRLEDYCLENEESLKKKDREDAEKREKFKQILIEGEREAILAKQKQKEEEAYLEQEFRRRLLEKFA